jgi:hypothetical protein
LVVDNDGGHGVIERMGKINLEKAGAKSELTITTKEAAHGLMLFIKGQNFPSKSYLLINSFTDN